MLIPWPKPGIPQDQLDREYAQIIARGQAALDRRTT